MKNFIDKNTKTIIKNGNCRKSIIYIKTEEEIDVWRKLKDKTLREISNETGINITRVFRLKSYGGMLLTEYKILKNYTLIKQTGD